MSDESLRRLERAREYAKWHTALLRIGKLTIYASQAGPKSILEERCATESCENTLTWSNCSFCSKCHDDKCYFRDGIYSTVGFATKKNSSWVIDTRVEDSCNTKVKNEQILAIYSRQNE